VIYGGDGLGDLEKVARRTTADLRLHKNEWDSIVVTGVSGLLVGPIVAVRLHKPLVVIRKQVDLQNSHASTLVENWLRLGMRYCLVDDFTSTGATITRVKKVVKERTDPKWLLEKNDYVPMPVPQMVAFYSYRDHSYSLEKSATETLTERVPMSSSVVRQTLSEAEKKALNLMNSLSNAYGFPGINPLPTEPIRFVKEDDPSLTTNKGAN